MPILLEKALLGAGFLVATLASWAYRRVRPRALAGVFEDFWQRLALTLRGHRPALYAAALAFTLGLVVSGCDRDVQAFFQAHTFIPRDLARLALRVGQYWTLVLSVVLIGAGFLLRRRLVREAGTAALQAVLATFLVTTLLKMLTGRLGPLNPELAGAGSFSRKTIDPSAFAFDFWNRVGGDGRFFWPSGHTATIATFVATLVAFAPERRWLPWVGFPAVAFMGLAMIEGDFHWASDVLAGGLIGAALGFAIGARARSNPRART